MSSAQKHKMRSQRSYRSKISTAEQFHSQQYVKTSQNKVMKEQGNFFARLMGLFKKGDK